MAAELRAAISLSKTELRKRRFLASGQGVTIRNAMIPDTPHDRLRFAREAAGFRTAKAFASYVKVPQPTYALHESGKRRIAPEVALTYATTLGCSAAWILTGEGNAPPVFSPAPAFQISETDVRALTGEEGQASRMDEHIDITQPWSVPLDFMKAQTTAPADKVKIVRIYGDSMSPLFMPGDRVLVDTSDTSPSPPGVFLLWDGLGVVVKRLEFIPYSQPATVRLSSANPAYGEFERQLDDIRINGRVIAKWLWT